MEYNEYSYTWPARPHRAFPPSHLAVYTKMGGQSAQVKMNGTNSPTFIPPDRKVFFKTRHNTDHKLWVPKPELLVPLRTLPGDRWNVLGAELLHSKVAGGPRDVLYIHDVMVANGQYLVGYTFAERQKILYEMFLGPVADEIVFSVFGDKAYKPPQNVLETTISHHALTPHIWLARNYTGDFGALFAALDKPEHEGLVLKTINARLAPCTRESANSDSQTKVRRVTGNQNYSF